MADLDFIPFYGYDPLASENNGLVKWFGDVKDYWDSDRGQYQLMAILDKLTGGLVSLDQRMSEMDSTLKLYGKTWSDVMNGYPYKTLAWGSTGAAFSAGLNFVSSNLRRLYS